MHEGQWKTPACLYSQPEQNAIKVTPVHVVDEVIGHSSRSHTHSRQEKDNNNNNNKNKNKNNNNNNNNNSNNNNNNNNNKKCADGNFKNKFREEPD